MSEFWVSKKKYFCKYCDIYIADDVPSRQQHENGLRHKGNKDRFIRELYKSGEKKKKDKEQEDREMKMVEQVRFVLVRDPESVAEPDFFQAAQAAYAKDVGVAAAEAAVASSSKSAPPAEKPKPKGDKWANYTTAASLGIVDVEGEAIAAAVALRQNEGRVGEWATMVVPPPPEAAAYDPSSAWALPTSSSIPTVKPERAATPEDDQDTRRFKVKQKTVEVGLGADLYDPGVIKIKKRDANGVMKQEEQSVPATVVPEWRPIQLTRNTPHQASATPSSDEKGTWEPVTTDQTTVKTEEDDSARSRAEESAPATDGPSVKTEPVDDKTNILISDETAPAASGSLFKKRKIKSSTAGGRRPQ
ncbi:hypothetical protein FRB95_002067 [Tulasnella sp. JGI-2019a]|nr:hypothetical protein FRB95_002067 [Tulasnella sp. JGI-2019a]